MLGDDVWGEKLVAVGEFSLGLKYNNIVWLLDDALKHHDLKKNYNLCDFSLYKIATFS